MAQKVQTLFVDDLDGSEAEGTVRFGLDGTDYEIDLNAKNAQQLRDALARYITARPPSPRQHQADSPQWTQSAAERPGHHRRQEVVQGPGHRRQRPRPDTRRTRGQI